MNRRASVSLLVALLSLGAAAQEDDDLAPLAPLPRLKPKPKPKPKPRPAPEDDDLAPIAPIARAGELAVRLAEDMSRAVLSVDGKDVGLLPLEAQSLPAGEHTVTVRRPGFAPFSKKVTVSGGKRAELEVRLTPMAAVLSVKSDLDDAQVLVDGRVIGTAPVVDHELPPGPVTISVLKEGYREEKQRLTLVAGRDYPIEVKFQAAPVATRVDRPVEQPLAPRAPAAAPPVELRGAPSEAPLYQRWYFWAGVGAAVVAVAAGTAAAVSAATAPPAKLSEQQICGGKCDGCIGFACASTARNPLTAGPSGWSF
jgi:hypothetical protein